MSTDLPEFVYAGTSKAASTWIHESLADHPDIFLPDTDAVNYFDINYHRGLDWYRDHFADADADQRVGEMTPTYLRTEGTAARIADTLDDPTLLFCLRNPVDRAFSHWWHGRQPEYWTYDFAEIFEVNPAYHMWAVPGFYAHHLDRYYEHFDAEQIHVFFFEDLVADDEAFVQDIYAALGVDDSYTPASVGEKTNVADYSVPDVFDLARRAGVRFLPRTAKDLLKPPFEAVRARFEDRSAYDEGMDPEVRRQLERLYLHDARRLSDLTGRDLDHWFEFHSLADDEGVTPGYGAPAED